MSSFETDPSMQFHPIYGILQDGLERMFHVLKSDCFTFELGGEEISSTVAETVLISPIISKLIESDSTINCFKIDNADISVNNFENFLDFIRCRENRQISREECLSFLNICRMIGNTRFSLILLSSLKSKMKSHSDMSSNMIDICDGTISSCASHFYLFSPDEIRCLDKQILHELLDSPFLRINNEESLLRMLETLGDDYVDFLKYLNISLLNATGFLHFIEIIKFDYLTYCIWLNIVERIRGIIDDSRRVHRHRDRPFSNQ
jgi:hypothetical protein